ncbi:PilZ domain-containing protein [Methylobacterium nodulans]|uniref:Type IV pilus assembly PilZ n=1 Tax=Methylobacterium nodulans (strain LMG 21967 / CNCM I-2342 / ORS 2060) TaxID=460265 RepID=B8IBG7_METNO|nr:PilZ domain-containing protein [Methylobacterium nodulans]ACL57382.1 type IV pilus assembly PilZ [Methylobacterium nodulans ORS 2060]
MKRGPIDARAMLSDSGKILVDFPPGLVSCVLRDLSSAGARLLVPDAISFPDRLRLVIDAERETLPCQVVWRRAGEIGVVFTWELGPAA